MTYLFDFDGTIVDVWRRYRYVFCCSADIDPSELSVREYRELRRSEMRDADIFNLMKGSPPSERFSEKKRSLLESPEALALDSLLIPSPRLLRWFASHDAYVVTMRRSKKSLIRQLANLSIGDIARRTIVLNPDKVKSKWDWVEHSFDFADGVKIFGDSKADMAVGQLANASAVFVDTGLFGWGEIVSSCPWCEYAESLLAALDREDALNNGVQGS